MLTALASLCRIKSLTEYKISRIAAKKSRAFRKNEILIHEIIYRNSPNSPKIVVYGSYRERDTDVNVSNIPFLFFHFTSCGIRNVSQHKMLFVCIISLLSFDSAAAVTAVCGCVLMPLFGVYNIVHIVKFQIDVISLCLVCQSEWSHSL